MLNPKFSTFNSRTKNSEQINKSKTNDSRTKNIKIQESNCF